MRAIKSVLAQTYQNFEIIVVDDGSTDTTEEVIKRYRDNRIKYIKHQKTKGPGAARNTGIDASSGDYIAFLDSDDEWQSTKIDAQIEIFRNRNLNPGLVYTGVKIINRDKRVIEKIIPIYKGYVFDKILSTNFIVGSSTIMIRRNVLDKVGIFDESLPSCEDWDLWIRIAQYYDFYFAPELLVKHYSHSKRISTQFGTVLLGLKMFSRKYEIKIDKLRNNVKAQHYFHLGNHFCYYGDKALAKKYLRRSFGIYPLNPIYFFSYIFILLFGRNAYTGLSTSTRTIRHKLHYIVLKK
jgi:glycosyltransferase involved in cell wall biosynthesis